MTEKKLSRHTVIPLLLLVYLCAMAWIGRDRLTVEKDYLGYFGTVAAELVIIAAVWVFLRKRDRIRRRHNDRSKYSEQ